jgi:glycerol-3-phosphate acyltransferase PlsX
MSEPVTIALDGMGGDRAPSEPVRGAIEAAREGVRILLVGDEATLSAELTAQGGTRDGIGVIHAPDVVGSSEDGAKAVRAKPQSSLVVACKLVADGTAQAVMSPGNTGATLAAATLYIRRIPGVMRPGIAVVMPSAQGPVVLIDAGANHETKSEYLQQFAVMGRLLARDVLQIPHPRVGLLSIGEEEGKGTELVQMTYDALEGSEGFVGNVEGRDIPKGTVDVIVTDGFTGNVALKLYEGVGDVMFSEIKAVVGSSLRGRLGGLLARPALRALRTKFNADTYGGAYLLGVRGLVVIGHGNAGGHAIANAIRMGARGVREDLVKRVEAGLAAQAVDPSAERGAEVPAAGDV